VYKISEFLWLKWPNLRVWLFPAFDDFLHLSKKKNLWVYLWVYFSENISKFYHRIQKFSLWNWYYQRVNLESIHCCLPSWIIQHSNVLLLSVIYSLMQHTMGNSSLSSVRNCSIISQSIYQELSWYYFQGSIILH
jgi:hypothetical protein